MTMTDQAQRLQTPSIDKERLRRKYLEERNKRLRADGNDQYLQVTGQLARYLDDPYTPVTPRAPKTDHVTFAFIGGGFAGLATAARLSVLMRAARNWQACARPSAPSSANARSKRCICSPASFNASASPFGVT